MYNKVRKRKRGKEYSFIHWTDEKMYSFSPIVKDIVIKMRIFHSNSPTSKQIWVKKLILRKNPQLFEKNTTFSQYFSHCSIVTLVPEHTEINWFRILKIKPCWTFCAIEWEPINIFRFRKKYFVQKSCINWMI